MAISITDRAISFEAIAGQTGVVPWAYHVASEHIAQFRDVNGRHLWDLTYGEDFVLEPADAGEGEGEFRLLADIPELATTVYLKSMVAPNQPYIAPPGAEGVERQMDRLAMALQDTRQDTGALRFDTDQDVLPTSPNVLIGFDENEKLAAFPLAGTASAMVKLSRFNHTVGITPQAEFQLDANPVSPDNVYVFVDGVYQPPDEADAGYDILKDPNDETKAILRFRLGQLAHPGWPRGTNVSGKVIAPVFSAAATEARSIQYPDGRQLPAALLPYYTKEQLDALTVPPEAQRIVVGGSIFEQKVGGPLEAPGLQYTPLDRRLDIAAAATKSDLASDFGGILAQLLVDCKERDLIAMLSANPDGDYWDPTFCDPVFSGEGTLHLEFGAGFKMKARRRAQSFAMNGAQITFTITDFDTSRGISCMYVDIANPTSAEKLHPSGTGGGAPEFTLVGNDITVTDPKSSQFRLVTSSRAPVIDLDGGRRSGANVDLNVFGDGVIDCSEAQAIIASASGTAFTFNFFRHVRVFGGLKGLNFGGDFLSPWEDRRMDTVLTVLGNKSNYIRYLEGFAPQDLVLYGSGGGSEGGEDDTEFTIVDNIVARRASAVCKNVRQARGFRLGRVTAVECVTGPLDGDTGNLESGREMHIADYLAINPLRYALDWRNIQGGCSVGCMTVVNPGRFADGTEYHDATAAMRFSGGRMVHVAQYLARDDGMSPVAGLPALVINGSNNYGLRVDHAVIEGFDVGIKETGGAANDVGLQFSGVMKDVAQPLELETGSRSRYDFEIMNTVGSVVESARYSGVGVHAQIPDVVDFAPIASFQSGSAVLTPTDKNTGELRRNLNGFTIRVLCEFSVDWSGAAPTGVFRVNLGGSGLTSALNRNARVVVTNYNKNVPVPAGATQLIGFMEATDDDLRFQALIPNADPQNITADMFAAAGTGKTVRIELQIDVLDEA